MSFNRNIIGALALSCCCALLLAGCVRASVSQLSSDTAVIEGRGSAFNDMGEVTQKMMGEAASLTVKDGYDSFVVIGDQGGYVTSYITSPGYYNSQTTATASAFGNTAYGSAYTTGYYTPPTVTPVHKPRGSMEIKMIHGACPQGAPNCFDARDVLKYQPQG